MTNITIYQFLSTSDPLNEADKSPVDNTVQIETPSKLARLEIIHRTRVIKHENSVFDGRK